MCKIPQTKVPKDKERKEQQTSLDFQEYSRSISRIEQKLSHKVITPSQFVAPSTITQRVCQDQRRATLFSTHTPHDETKRLI